MRNKTVLGVLLCLALILELCLFAARQRHAVADPLVGARAYAGDAPTVFELGWTTRFDFYAPLPAVDALRVELGQRLNGAKVNVTGHHDWEAVLLVRQQRINLNHLDILWEGVAYDWIELEVLNHHRPAPALRRWAWFNRRLTAG